MSSDIGMEVYNAEVKKPRMNWIDASKGLGIIMIMWGHLNYLSNPVSSWCSSFKLALFYILSGYLFSLNEGKYENSKEYIAKRFRTMGVPYVVFTLIAIILVSAKQVLSNSFEIKSFCVLVYSAISLRGVSTLWFIPSLFIGEIVFLKVVKKSSVSVRKVLFIVCPIICSVLSMVFVAISRIYSEYLIFELLSYPFLTVSRAVIACWFYCVGYYLLKIILENKTISALICVGGY